MPHKKIITLLASLFFLFIADAHASSRHDDVDRVLGATQPQNMWRDLAILTQFPDRSATQQNGLLAASWLTQQIQHIVQLSKRQDASVRIIPTRWRDQQGHITTYKQSSIVLKIGNSHQAGIVIGAHFDTVGCGKKSCKRHSSLIRPGADDDGSGVVTLLEMARTLLNTPVTLKRPIYLIWYAAEEDDLDGSKSVVADFMQQQIPIAAVMQLDMTGYARHKSRTIWLSDTGHYRHVDKALTHFTYRLAKQYVRAPVGITHLDDESDHWSWQEAGYKTVFPMEANCHGNKASCPYREHTANDTMETLSLTHMTDYLKLALAFSVTLANTRVLAS